MRKKIGRLIFCVLLVWHILALIPIAIVSSVLWVVGMLDSHAAAFWYNEDRTICSGLYSTYQETISSEVGRIALGAGQPDGWTPRWEFEKRWATALADWLNRDRKIWGADHTSNAIRHADELDRADDGKEQ